MSTVKIDNTTHDIDWDEDGAHWAAMPPPLCTCGESLGEDGDSTNSKINIHSEWMDDQHVECGCCGETFPIDGVSSLTSRRQGDGAR